MHKRQLGGRDIGAIGFGTMSLGGAYGPSDEAQSLAVLDAAWEAGITHFDTANIYGMGVSEEVLGIWLKSRGHQPLLATKASIVPGPPRRIDNSESHLRGELEASLRRLGRDHVDIFYLHRRELERPLEEVIATMAALIAEGKIGGYGLSEIAPTTLRKAHALLPCTAVQNEYSLLTRLPELGLIQSCAQLGVAFVAFSPLTRGLFADQDMAPPMDSFRRANPRFTGENFRANLALAAGFRTFAASRGWSTSAAALAWVLDQAPHIIPLPGTRLAAHLQSWLAAPEIRFSAEDRAEIARLLPLGSAHGDRYSHAQTVGIELYA